MTKINDPHYVLLLAIRSSVQALEAKINVMDLLNFSTPKTQRIPIFIATIHLMMDVSITN